MKDSIALRSFKQLLTRLGPKFSKSNLAHFQAMVNYLEIGRWMSDRQFVFKNRVPTREDVWKAIVSNAGDRRILYLEFGVARGDATRWWSSALKHPEAILHGFDSFQGMPENGGIWKKGQFSTQGEIPVIDDPRVRFFKGWFDQTLPNYIVPAHDQMLINVDADLYSSTIYILRHFRPHIKAGTLVYFDDMHVMDHEPRAFDEFMEETGLRFTPISAEQSLCHVAFKCLGTARRQILAHSN